ncbi:MAG: sulfatase [candidate division WOR-3 bacterium]|nr:MAG: sulfatase [candidate division WOR-3 bacterium]
MDATRAKNLSCYGYSRPTTPNLERFAEHSVLYETAISPAGWTLPSHASMFTGLYPSRHGAHDQHQYLLPEYPTLAEHLRSLGYNTYAYCYNPYVSSSTGTDRGFEWFNVDFNRIRSSLNRIFTKIDNGLARLTGRRDSGARFINRLVRTALHQLKSEDRPFFMFIHYDEPHAPYRPPAKYNRYLPTGVSPGKARNVKQDQWEYLIDSSILNERDFEILTALYDGEITYLDNRLGTLFGWLEELGMLDRTMIALTADHGDNIGDHQLLSHKYCLYDTLLHVPLIVRYPAGTAQPGRIEHQVQTLDLFPTILALLGDNSSEIYQSLQGIDMLSSSKREFTFAEQARPNFTTMFNKFPEADVSRYDSALKMIRSERYKYIWNSKGDCELLDIRTDPGEEHNIITDQPDIATDLDKRLKDWLNSFEHARPSDRRPEFDDEAVERLRGLGYLD